eukprot:GHVL01042717.1.p1 GENE.GHVL01042717.1~~GHVL01042717.1.p1  ORF type:complete len:417 (+),score=89.40 GHVL01042717.1:569-1819(+)
MEDEMAMQLAKLPEQQIVVAGERKRKKGGNWDAGPSDVIYNVASGSFLGALTSGSIEQHQQPRQARKLYVGNLPDRFYQQELQDFFNGALNELSNQGNLMISEDPVVSIQSGAPQNWVFLELKTAADATCAMTLDGIVYKNQALTIRRPREYAKMMNNATAVAVSNGLDSVIPLSSGYRIYLGNLPKSYDREKVRRLLEEYGPLKVLELVFDPPGSNTFKGAVFFEYETPEDAKHAMEVLNGMELEDDTLRCQVASIGAKTFITREQVLGENVAPQASQQVVALVEANSAMALGHNPMLVQQVAATVVMGQKPSSVIQLLNMVSREDLLDDDVYRDIMQDILNEVKKFGPVIKILIPKPLGPDAPPVPGDGKVFVQFDSLLVAKKARKALAGRQFQRRSTVASYFPEAMFREGDLT